MRRSWRVEELTPEQVPSGTRIRVTHVAPSEAEQLGYVDDTSRLLGQTAEVIRLTSGTFPQLVVEWDDLKVGRGLMLASRDEIEIIERR
jgi:hypothetical protein